MARNFRGRSAGGFTVIDLAASVAVLAAGSCCLVGMSGGDNAPPTPPAKGGEGDAEPNMIAALVKARAAARQLKDATQVRGIMQSLVIFAQNNKESYPLPSVLDASNATISLGEGENARSPWSKNTTANIHSILIFNGNISPELCVSPAEVSKRISVMTDYSYSSPKAAANPMNALWDPAFTADFTKRGGGNVSYANLQPSEKRRAHWSDTFSATEAIIGNRGPLITEAGVDESGAPTARTRLEKSKTFRIHGDPKTWEGNIAYNDGHVNFETKYTNEGVTYTPIAKKQDKDPKQPVGARPDNFFFDEQDDANGNNAYLGVWVKAGDKPEEFKGIWD